MAETITAPSTRRGRQPGPGFAGAAAAGLAVGLTELFAGLVDGVPSAIASIGAVIVDRSPAPLVEVAISLFGTADKGALAIGTVLVVIVIGAVVGRLAAHRAWVGPAAFGAVATAGIAAGLDQPDVEPAATIFFVALSAFAGVAVLRRLTSAVVPELPTDALPDDASRRRFLNRVAGVGVAAAAAGVGGRWLLIRRSEEPTEAMAFPTPVTRAPPPGTGADFGILGVDPIVVPQRDFYRIDTALIVPRPNLETWQLGVTGMVDRELQLTMDDLLAMDLHERYVTIACVSNPVGGRLVGNAKWTGVLLSEVLDMAGVRPGASQVVGRSVDRWTAGFPTELVFDGREPLIAIGMNDEQLAPDHGFPARLIVPGLYGYVSATKWLQEIELTTWEIFDGYWIPRGWAKTGPIKTQSRIDVPGLVEQISASPLVIAGVAWAPLKGIERVEIQVDDGAWEEAELTTPLSDAAWVQWRLETQVPPGNHRARVRATDGTGVTQTEDIAPPAPDGATGWDGVGFTTV